MQESYQSRSVLFIVVVLVDQGLEGRLYYFGGRVATFDAVPQVDEGGTKRLLTCDELESFLEFWH